MEIKAGEFKAKCLELMDQVAEGGEEIIITKRGKAVAKLVPVASQPSAELLGCMQGTVEIFGDLIAPLGVKWEANG